MSELPCPGCAARREAMARAAAALAVGDTETAKKEMEFVARGSLENTMRWFNDRMKGRIFQKKV